MPINLSNDQNRDAVVALESLRDPKLIFYVDKKGKPTTSRRVLKSDSDHDLEKIQGRKKINTLAKNLVEDDPEVDIESFGMFLTDTSRVYVSASGIVHLVEEFDVIKNPDGTVRDRRPGKKELQNINTEFPVRWTGKYIPKETAVKKFVFTNKKQIMHINGLTFDFLFKMAEDLAERDSLLLLRAGEKGDKPIVMNRGGKQYNAFLEGRVKGESYCLILHLSNMELKKPEAGDADG